MGRTTSFKKNFKPLGFRSPSWRISNFFANLKDKAKLSRLYEKRKFRNRPPELNNSTKPTIE